jgi:hypothetical protein
MVPPRQHRSPVGIPTTRVVRIIPVDQVGRVTQAVALVIPAVLTARTIPVDRMIRKVGPMVLMGPVTPEGIRVAQEAGVVLVTPVVLRLLICLSDA